MEFEASGAKVEGSGKCDWKPTMSTFMLTFLADVVANGTKTSSGFKKVHLNACARALNEHFKLNRTGDQIANHLRTWKRKYIKMNNLRKLSAALWDEENFIISLDHEHYTDYIKDHKADDEYLNKPLEHYGLMATIFGNSVATGQYAKGSGEPLATEIDDTDAQQGNGNGGNVTATAENEASSSTTRPSKRAKIAENEEDKLIGAFERVSDKLAAAIVEAAKADNELPPDLFHNVTSLAGFEDTHKAYFYSYLVGNPREARAFNNVPFDYKLILMAKYLETRVHFGS